MRQVLALYQAKGDQVAAIIMKKIVTACHQELRCNLASGGCQAPDGIK
jgi:hypothetical protein